MIDYIGELSNKNATPTVILCYPQLSGKVKVGNQPKLKILTFLILVLSLKLINLGKQLRCYGRNYLMMENLLTFLQIKFQPLLFICLKILKSVYRKPLPFPHLKEMTVNMCYKLKKLPLDYNSEHKICYWRRRTPYLVVRLNNYNIKDIIVKYQ